MEILKLFFEKIENKLHTFFALIIGILIIFSGIIASDNFFSKYINQSYLEWVYLSLLFIWLIFWLQNRYWIPKSNKKKTTLVLCIHADSHEAEQNLKKDFISSVKKQITSQNIAEIFDVIVIKNHIAEKYNNIKSIYKLHKRVRGNIYIFGDTKKRKNGDDQYFLSLDGLVLHRPVPIQVSQELSKDFLATLPKGINFKDDFAFAGFQVSADIVVKSVEYIIGIAAFISGNPFLATKVHTDLKIRINSSPQKSPADKLILTKLDELLSNEYAIIAAYYLGKGDKDKTNENVTLSLNLNQNCYRALIVQSIIFFSWESDPKKSLSVLKKCHTNNDPTWRYNEAFLHFWLGNYPSALKQCEKIKKYANDFFISQEVIDFNEAILANDNSKFALYFWLGFNYYYKQNNLPLALKSFELFEKQADTSALSLKQKSSPWLVEIKRQMNLN